MEASLYLLLPVEKGVLDIPLTYDALCSMFSSLINVKVFAKKENINLRIFYDKENISQFMADARTVVDDGAYLNKPYLMLQEFVSKASTEVHEADILDPSCCYARWDTITCGIDVDAPLVVKCAFESPTVTCVLSLSPLIPTEYYLVSIIKDKIFGEGLPKLKSVPLFFNADNCVQWLSSQLDGRFSLLRGSVFQRTHFRWNNQSIFKKKSDDTYWYLDYFHRDNYFHYEVFNRDGVHLGEASSEGQLIAGTNDPSKSISHIIHGH